MNAHGRVVVTAVVGCFLLTAGVRIAGAQTRLQCDDPGAVAPAANLAVIEVTTSGQPVQCTYQPPVDRDGVETFEYEVVSTVTKLTSAPAIVTMDTKRQGLRWEIVTAAGQTVAGDDPASGLNSIPDVLGKTTGDVMLSMDWVFRQPQKQIREGSLGATADGHVVIRTGYITRPEAVTATPVTTTDAPDTTPAPSGGASEDALEARRKFSFGGETNYNWVLSSTGTGTFLSSARSDAGISTWTSRTMRHSGRRPIES